MIVKYFNNELELDIDEFIRKLVNDMSISDDLWERKYQHVRDDLCGVAAGEFDFAEIAELHRKIHNINVWSLAKRYGVINEQ